MGDGSLAAGSHDETRALKLLATIGNWEVRDGAGPEASTITVVLQSWSELLMDCLIANKKFTAENRVDQIISI